MFKEPELPTRTAVTEANFVMVEATASPVLSTAS